jgi:hypothetical protein
MNTQPEQAQLDRIELMQVEQSSILRQLWAEVNALKAKSSFWGAVGGAAAILLTRLAGCI